MSMYNSAQTVPKITLIVVNKKINQRFFVEDRQGRLQNPPSGCIIDRQLVEQEGSNAQTGEAFDFYLTPATANQGCVLPTHLFVALNESGFSKIEIEQLSFSLCFFYYNWSGAIKVPAPCQYAHKVAEFYMTIGFNRKRGPF